MSLLTHSVRPSVRPSGLVTDTGEFLEANISRRVILR